MKNVYSLIIESNSETIALEEDEVLKKILSYLESIFNRIVIY